MSLETQLETLNTNLVRYNQNIEALLEAANDTPTPPVTTHSAADDPTPTPDLSAVSPAIDLDQINAELIEATKVIGEDAIRAIMQHHNAAQLAGSTDEQLQAVIRDVREACITSQEVA
ncbi:MAG: hypothetical protein M3H12_20000 [Chromatiales bacterium]|nr:hypothetical protein [Gammaproteobacteria bacterium]